jgi:DNA-binding transcriptional ArsR family regulator
MASPEFGLDAARPIHNNVVVDQLSATLAALADPTRRSILHRLADGPAPVRDLAQPYRMSQQAVSKHIACLESAHLIEKRRDGRLHICTLDPKPLKEVSDWAEEYRAMWEANFARLDSLLEEMKAIERRRRGAKRQGERR